MLRCARLCRLLVVCLLLLGAGPSWASTIDNFSPGRHNRFASGGYAGSAVLNPNAFFAAYDFSGIGRTGANPVTMITPVHGLAAAHYAPAGTVTFVNAFGALVTRQVASTQQIQDGSNGNADTDLLFVTLDAPLSGGDEVATYNLTFPTGRDPQAGTLSSLGQAEILVYGNQHAVGRNEIDGSEHAGLFDFGYVSVGSSLAAAAIFDFDPITGFSPDESKLVSGDSGHPDFISHGGELSLFGIHWAVGTASDNTPINISTFAPYYWSELNTLVGNYNVANGTSYQFGLTDVLASIPEPTTALLLTLGLTGLGMRRRTR
jgi:hypothetical protein